ncbi:MAG: PKD domain-containing protein, partial [Candidatus Thermoplasmatota archaeon]|nr:PKD domain-containing protein [Candidatus Thermoplasmatota archaeon]
PVADAGPDQLVNTTEVSFNGTGSYDPDGTIESYTWQFGDGQTGSGATVTHDYEENGQYTVTLNVTDDAGAYDTDTCQVIVDTVPPETTATLNGTQGERGWYTGNVTVTLEAEDNTSGVNATYYSLDGGNWTVYTQPFNVTAEGQHTVLFYSDDEAGNREDQHTLSVNIDTSPPTVTITSPAEGYIHFFGRELLPSIRGKTILIGRITVEAEATDQASWIDKVQFSVDGEVRYNDMQEPYTWTWGLAFGRHTLGVTAIDAAGHEATEEIEVTIFSLIPGRSGDVTQDQTSTPPAS